jgi:hypothetical protein
MEAFDQVKTLDDETVVSVLSDSAVIRIKILLHLIIPPAEMFIMKLLVQKVCSDVEVKIEKNSNSEIKIIGTKRVPTSVVNKRKQSDDDEIRKKWSSFDPQISLTSSSSSSELQQTQVQHLPKTNHKKIAI